MENIVDKLMPFSIAFVLGLIATHPLTWRQELALLEYRMMKDSLGTRSWGRLPIVGTPNRHPQNARAILLIRAK